MKDGLTGPGPVLDWILICLLALLAWLISDVFNRKENYMKQKSNLVLRQGDVLLTRVNALPHGASDVTTEGRIVLAEGEATGHAHAVYEPITKDAPKGKARMWNAGAERFLQIVETTALKHEEHAAIPLEPGIYRIGLQREYSPEEIRRVAD